MLAFDVVLMAFGITVSYIHLHHNCELNLYSLLIQVRISLITRGGIRSPFLLGLLQLFASGGTTVVVFVAFWVAPWSGVVV